MAINVTKFMVSNDLRSLELDITCDAGATITSIALWNEDFMETLQVCTL